MNCFAKYFFFITISGAFFACTPQQPAWTHLSSKNGAIAAPNTGNQQTATALFDVNLDGMNDFLVTERTTAPAVVCYLKTAKGWRRYIVEDQALPIEAGSAWTDIDGDGDIDVVFGGDSTSNGVWWWENPYPNYDPDIPWRRHIIKQTGANKHHDQMFIDHNGDGKEALVFWNQHAHSLYLAEIPANPKQGSWPYTAIYTYSDKSEPAQRGTYPDWKGINEHEGLTKIDIDGDGILDIVGGGRWFKYLGGDIFAAHVIDESYSFSRSAAGDFIKGGRPEVILSAGDGRAPLIMYEWQKGEWLAKILLDTVQDGHSIAVVDFNGDGNLDLFSAEMRLGKNPHAVTRILLGDGMGNFADYIVHTGFGLHESRIADLDGDGDYDILGKPYTWDAPRLDIWLQN